MSKFAFLILIKVAIIGMFVTTLSTIALSFIITAPFWIFFFGLIFTVFAPLIMMVIAYDKHGYKLVDDTDGNDVSRLFQIFPKKRNDLYITDNDDILDDLPHNE